MKKTLLLALATTFLLSSSAFARIVVECDNYTDHVNYRSYKAIGMHGVAEYAFIKSTAESSNENYYLRLTTVYRNHSSMAPRYLMDKTADIVVDGVTYKIPKVVNDYFPHPFDTNAYTMPFTFYKFTDESIAAMKTGKEISFVVNAPGKETTTIVPNESNRREFQRMYELTFADYKADKNINEGL